MYYVIYIRIIIRIMYQIPNIVPINLLHLSQTPVWKKRYLRFMVVEKSNHLVFSFVKWNGDRLTTCS